MKFPVLFLSLSIIIGCRSYAPDPIDWAQERSAWAEASAAPLCLTLAEAQRYALLLNPEINALRLRHAASSNTAAQTGWWDDPEVGVDVLRMMKGVPKPWIADSALAFTIPVNGVPALERKAAEAYAFADACAIAVAERELMVSVGHAWNGLFFAQRHRAFLSDQVVVLEGLQETARRLVEAGELDAADGTRLQLDASRMRGDFWHVRAKTEEQRLSLLRLIGFHPSAPITFDDADDDEGALLFPDEDALPNEDALIRHPDVLEKLARLGASEADLRTEIRRQYPDLKIGPALQSEDGVARAGVTLGMTLPLWNRNRKAVAAAEGERQQARTEALNTWKRLAAELALAKEALRQASDCGRTCCGTALPAAQQSLDTTRRLYEAGEADVMALSEAFQTYVANRFEWLEARRTLRETQIEMSRFRE